MGQDPLDPIKKMDKLTNTLKTDEIRKLAELKQYKKALNVLETMDISKIKAVTDLNVFAEVLEQNEMFYEAKELLLRIYDKNKTRRVVFCLINLLIKMSDYEDAESYYNQYITIAPKDADRFILRYKLDKAKKKPLENLIADLEELKDEKYMEEWSLELAKLYHKAGLKDKCVRECNDIILWFGEGTTVERAHLLKEYYIGNNEKLNAIRACQQEEIEQNKELLKTKDYTKERKEINVIFADNENPGDDFKEFLTMADNTKLDPIPNSTNDKLEMDNTFNDKEDTTSIDIQEGADTNHDIEDTNNILELKELEKSILTQEMDLIIDHVNISHIFSGYLKIHIIKDQIYSVFNTSDKSKPFKNIMVTGLQGSGKTDLSKKLLTAFFKLGYIKTSKIAKVTSDRLNKMQLDDKLNKLLGGCIIIEKAGALSSITMDKLMDIMITNKEDIILVFEDTKEAMNQLKLKHPGLKDVVPYTLDIPEYTMEELMVLVKDYYNNEDYILEEDALSVLEDITKKIISTKLPEERLSSLIQVAIKSKEAAERRNMKKLSLIKENGKYEELDLLTIKMMDIME